MAKKRKSSKSKKQDPNDTQEKPERNSGQPKTEIHNLIAALETKDNVPMLKSSISAWTNEGEDENIVDSPSFLDGDTTPTTETKLIVEAKKPVPRVEHKNYVGTGGLFGDVGVFLTELTEKI